MASSKNIFYEIWKKWLGSELSMILSIFFGLKASIKTTYMRCLICVTNDNEENQSLFLPRKPCLCRWSHKKEGNGVKAISKGRCKDFSRRYG